MQKFDGDYDLKNGEIDPAAFNANNGQKPFQFAIYMSPASVKATRDAVSSIRTQLLNIIPGNNHEIHVTDQVIVDGNSAIQIHPEMIALRMDYLDQQPQYITISFVQDGAESQMH
jgi:hypothetical protein